MGTDRSDNPFCHSTNLITGYKCVPHFHRISQNIPKSLQKWNRGIRLVFID